MKRDFENYLLSIQKQYTEMNKAAEEANQMLSDGQMTQEQANVIQQMVNTVNTNYQRVLYCKYLYDLPPKFIQKLQNKKLQAQTKKFIEEKADKESVESETKEAVDKIKEEVNSVE